MTSSPSTRHTRANGRITLLASRVTRNRSRPSPLRRRTHQPNVPHPWNAEPVLSPPPVPPTPAPSNRFSHFDNHDMSSDSDDDAEFEMEYGNNVDSTSGTIPGGSNSTKSNHSSFVYLANNQFRLPFGGLCKPLNLQRKLAKVLPTAESNDTHRHAEPPPTPRL